MKRRPAKKAKAAQHVAFVNAILDEIRIWREQQSLRTLLVVFKKEGKLRTSYMRMLLKNHMRLKAAQSHLDTLFDFDRNEFRAVELRPRRKGKHAGK